MQAPTIFILYVFIYLVLVYAKNNLSDIVRVNLVPHQQSSQQGREMRTSSLVQEKAPS